MIIEYNESRIYVSFNHNHTYCCFGTNIGFYIYEINPFKKMISRKIEGGVSLIKMLHESNIIIFVGNNSGLYPNNKLIIWDEEKKSAVGEISFNSKIDNIRITKKYILVMCNKKIHIYLFDNLVLVKTITTQSESKLMAIGLEESQYIAYPSEIIGSINITKIDEDYLEAIEAHTNVIENVLLSDCGKYLVSASERGTLIRIFDIHTRVQIRELRRGCDPAKITNLALSSDNKVLLVSSDKGTIHLYHTNINTNEQNNHYWENYGIKYLKPILPDYFNSIWSFCQIYLTNLITYSVIDNTISKIYTLADNGQFYIIDYSDPTNPVIEETIKYISDESDPFSDRSSTIR